MVLHASCMVATLHACKMYVSTCESAIPMVERPGSDSHISMQNGQWRYTRGTHAVHAQIFTIFTRLRHELEADIVVAVSRL